MKKINFNSNWKYCLKGTENWINVNLPHDAMIHRERIKKLKNGSYTGFYPSGDYTYIREIYGDAAYDGKTLILEFEGVYMDSSVYLNNEKVGGHVYGYSNFYVDITDRLMIGKENELRVEVHCSQVPNARWYPGNGIYRPVNLYVGEKSHILLDGVHIVTESFDPAVLHIISDAVSAEDCEVEIQILDQKEMIAKGSGTDCRIEIPDAKLWNEETPYLYTARVMLKRSEIVIDEQNIPFGIRKLEWSSRKGLQVNGKTVKLRGGCVHHDNGILGACDFEAAAYRKVRIMKESGFNAIRSAHYPIGKNMLRACDELGMYIMDEAFDTWRDTNGIYGYTLDFEKEWRDDLRKMVLKDRNHPSVIMYSIGNEISDTAREDGVELAAQMTELCHYTDSSRPVLVCPNLFMNTLSKMGLNFSLGDGKELQKTDVTDPLLEAPDSEMGGSAAINVLMMTGPALMKLLLKPKRSEKGSGPVYSKVDIAGYNYGEQVYEGHHKMAPDRIIVGSETHPPTIAHNWKLVMDNPYVIGDFMWTGWDYLGEVGVGVIDYGKNSGVYVKPYPSISAYTGAINLIGYRDLYSHLAAMVWGKEKKPYIAVQPPDHSGEEKHLSHYRFTDAFASWTWPGCEDRKTVVEVYSPDDKVELFLNGKSLGRKRPADFCAKYKVSYQPGSLKVISYDRDGNVVGNAGLTTAGQSKQLRIKVEQKKIRANGEDLAFINIALTDDDGIVQMLQEQLIHVSVTGAGRLQAIGTGNPRPEEPYVGNCCTTYQGRAQAIVRSGFEPGVIQVKISGEGVGDKVAKIIVE